MTEPTLHRMIPGCSATLTSRQRMFCERVVGGATGAEAARQAGYSSHAAAQQASRLLGQNKIRDEIDRLRANAEEVRQAALDRMLSKVGRVYNRALRDRQCAAALRAVEVEVVLRQIGARTLPEDIHPGDLELTSGPETGMPDLEEYPD